MNEPLWKATLEEPEARGEVWIERSPYGFEVYVKGANVWTDAEHPDGKEEPVALIDLFPSVSGEPRAKGVVVQLVLGSNGAGGDPMAYARYGKEFCVVDFEGGVYPCPLRDAEHRITNTIYGYDDDIERFITQGGTE